MPCLNESDTLEICIRKAQRTLLEHDIAGEVVVADNGSSDGSLEIAESLGARVVPVSRRGYGSALMGGIAAAEGRFVIMGDADDSYDFCEIPRFVERLRAGDDLVMGCRLPSGGGRVMEGAMPATHRWVGNPLFSFLARRMFGVPTHDVYCGMRGFTRELYGRLNQRCTGMEFATEMVIKSTLVGARIGEVPITLHPDGRKSHPPHLRTMHDGWRTLRFFMLCSPKWLYLLPGTLLIALGLLGYALALPGQTVLGAELGPHTLLFASAALMMGFQAVLFGALATMFAMSEHIVPRDAWVAKLLRLANLERVLIVSAVVFLAGCGLLAWSVVQWWQVGFGHLDYARTMRSVIPGVLLSCLGFQGIWAAFFASFLNLRRR
jgi:hypothetical protein